MKTDKTESNLETKTTGVPKISIIDLRKHKEESIKDIIYKYKDRMASVSSPCLKKYKQYAFALDYEKNMKSFSAGVILEPNDSGFTFRLFDENSTRVAIPYISIRRLMIRIHRINEPLEFLYYIN